MISGYLWGQDDLYWNLFFFFSEQWSNIISEYIRTTNTPLYEVGGILWWCHVRLLKMCKIIRWCKTSLAALVYFKERTFGENISINPNCMSAHSKLACRWQGRAVGQLEKEGEKGLECAPRKVGGCRWDKGGPDAHGQLVRLPSSVMTV